jgi:hypothetical protein
MANWGDVERLALALPETEEKPAFGSRAWRVRKKLFVWERPLRKADFEALGDDAPDGDVLGAKVPDEVAKQALVAEEPGIYFTTPHFDGYPSVLVRLDEIPLADLEELTVEAWLTQAGKRLSAKYLDSQAGS